MTSPLRNIAYPSLVMAVLALAAPSRPAQAQTGTVPADIQLSPDFLAFEMAAGETAWSSFTISNVGATQLDFQLAIPSSGLIIISPGTSTQWISVEPRQGYVSPGDSREIRVRFDARQLSPGWPVGTEVLIRSNDPDRPLIEYMVTLKLLPFLPVPAVLDIRPDNLRLARGGAWITAWIELPAEFDPATILVPSVRLGGIPPADSDHFSIKDHNHNGIPELSLKFDRDAIVATLRTGNEVELLVTGDIIEGRTFSGKTSVQVFGRSTNATVEKSGVSSPTTWSAVKSRFQDQEK